MDHVLKYLQGLTDDINKQAHAKQDNHPNPGKCCHMGLQPYIARSEVLGKPKRSFF